MTRTRSQEVEIRGDKDGFALSDLRWLVEQAKDLDPDTDVRLHYDAGAQGSYSQFDRGYATLSVKNDEGYGY